MDGSDTFFAPAERTSDNVIFSENNLIGSQEFFTGIFGAMNGISAIIDKNRQIVYANNEFLELLGIDSIEPILGKRPGEVVTCVNSGTEPSGCGTAKACRYCGAVNAIMESQVTNKRSVRETSITSYAGGKLLNWDLKITSAPMKIGTETFYVFSLSDISHQKKLAVIERTFFHDILNEVGGLTGLLSILKDETNAEETRKIIDLSEETVHNIIEEIQAFSLMRQAEDGELVVKAEFLNAAEFLKTLAKKMGYSEPGIGKNMFTSVGSDDIEIETDKALLQRVLINLLKNSLEATPKGGSIYCGVEEAEGKIIFFVRNSSFMSEDVQMKIFQRAFSTKGTGRGVGTYSIRLLTENYLKGKVLFSSSETEGTIFKIELNREFIR